MNAIDPDERQWDLNGLSAPDMQIVSDFLERASGLNPAARDRLARTLADRVTQEIGARQPLDPISFLHRVAFLKEIRPSRGDVDPEELQWDLQQLSSEDLQSIHEFLERAPRLDPETRRRLGEKLAEQVTHRIQAREPLDPVKFLDRVFYLASVQD